MWGVFFKCPHILKEFGDKEVEGTGIVIKKGNFKGK